MNGQEVLEKNIAKHESLLLIDLIQYPFGMYKILFINDNGITIQKSILIN